MLRALCALPPRWQRLLAGPAPELDGQRLASDIWMLLRLAALAGEESVTAGGASPEQARALNRRGAAACAGPPLADGAGRGAGGAGAGGGDPGAAVRAGGAAAAARPLLVYFHGGGWVIGDLDTHDCVCRLLAAAAGRRSWSRSTTAWRRSIPSRAAVDDAVAALRWAAEHAAELGVDPARVAVGGDSAGGNLAAVASLLRPRRRRPAAGDAAPLLPGHRRRRRAAAHGSSSPRGSC